MRIGLALVGAVVLAGCVQAPHPVQPTVQRVPSDIEAAAQDKARQFVRAVSRVEPIAEQECGRRTQGQNCDFLLVIDDNPNAPPNAFQTLQGGRPVIGFTVALIAMSQNEDELAFVMSHEAAHHIRGHLARQAQNASLGGAVFAGLAGALGASSTGVQTAQQLGATVGARRYSKDFELEADELGAVIAERAGYDALRGAAFFNRIADPGDRFLGTHPPNAARVAIVQKTVARLRSGS